MKIKSTLIWITLLALSLTGISFYGGPITYVFFWFTVLVPVICLIYIVCVISMLRIYQKSEGRSMVCASPSDFYITLNNESFFAFSSLRIVFYSSFSTVTGLDDETVYELLPHSSVTKRTRLVCRYRGEYLVGIKEIIVGDFLGLFSVTYRIKEPLSVIVAPAIIKLDELKSIDNIEDADRDSLTDRNEADIPVREYVPGDDIRFIHHKASATMQKLMVRERIGGEKTGIAIIMEAGRYGEEPEEYLPSENSIIESTLALSLYYVGKNIPVDVMYMAGAAVRTPLHSHTDFESLYETMRSYSFREKEDTLRLIDEITQHRYISDHRMLIFILHHFDADRASLVEKMNMGRVPVKVYTVDEYTSALTDGNTDVIHIGTSRTEDVL